MTTFNQIAAAVGVFFVSASSHAHSLVIPDGPREYGYMAFYQTGFSQDAQSFIATGSWLTGASILVRDQGFYETDMRWKFQLWSDTNGRPGSVFAEFGSYDPGLEQSRFKAVAGTPVQLSVGQRYYLGLAPEMKVTVMGTGVLVPGFAEAEGDVYANGTTWAIGLPGYSGEQVFEPNNFDLSLTISMVPEPNSWALFLAGGFAMAYLRRRKHCQ